MNRPLATRPPASCVFPERRLLSDPSGTVPDSQFTGLQPFTNGTVELTLAWPALTHSTRSGQTSRTELLHAMRKTTLTVCLQKRKDRAGEENKEFALPAHGRRHAIRWRRGLVRAPPYPD